MGRKRKTEKRHAGVTPANLSPEDLKWFQDHAGEGFENVTVNDVGHIASSAHEEDRANQLERDLILNRILMAVIKAHPIPENKDGDGPKLARLQIGRAHV